LGMVSVVEAIPVAWGTNTGGSAAIWVGSRKTVPSAPSGMRAAAVAMMGSATRTQRALPAQARSGAPASAHPSHRPERDRAHPRTPRPADPISASRASPTAARGRPRARRRRSIPAAFCATARYSRRLPPFSGGRTLARSPAVPTATPESTTIAGKLSVGGPLSPDSCCLAALSRREVARSCRGRMLQRVRRARPTRSGLTIRCRACQTGRCGEGNDGWLIGQLPLSPNLRRKDARRFQSRSRSVT
jgi:hypothetical protein